MASDVQILITAQDRATQSLNAVANKLESLNSRLSTTAGFANTASENMEKASKSALSLSGSVTTFLSNAVYFTAMGAAIGGVTSAITAGADAFVSYNAKMEQTIIAYSTMLGSASAATEFINQMKDFAAKTPFDFAGVDSGAKKLMAYGWQVKQIIPDLTTIGDAVAALGTGNEGIDRIVVALGQLSMKARVDGQDIKQLTENFVPAADYLMKKFNLSADVMNDWSKAGITGLQAVRGILEEMAADPKFKNMMQAQSRTMIGLWSTLKDNLTEIAGKIGESTSGKLADAMVAATDKTQQFVTIMRSGNLLQAMNDVFGESVTSKIWNTYQAFSLFTDSVTNVGSVISSALGGSGGVIDMVLSNIVNGMAAVDSVTQYLRDHTIELTFAVSGLAAGYAVLKWEAIASGAASTAVALADVGSFFSLVATEGAVATSALAGTAGATGVLASGLAILVNPLTWVAAGVAAVTAATGYMAYEMSQDAPNVARIYTPWGTQMRYTLDNVASAAEVTAGRVETAMDRLARAANSKISSLADALQRMKDIAEIQDQSKVGGIYEDMTARAMDAKTNGGYSTKERTQALAQRTLDTYKGRDPIPYSAGSGSSGNKAANAYESQAKKMEELMASLDEKIEQTLGTTPSIALARLNSEITKAQNDIDEASKTGVDTSGVSSKLNEYYADAQKKINDDLLKVQKKFSQETLTIESQNSDDKMAIAMAELQNTKESLAEKTIEWQKAGITQEEIDRRTKAYLEAADKKYTEAVRPSAKERASFLNQTSVLIAETADNGAAAAMAEYQAVKSNLKYEYEEKKKITNDKAALDTWYYAELNAADKKRVSAVDAALTSQYELEKKYHAAMAKLGLVDSKANERADISALEAEIARQQVIIQSLSSSPNQKMEATVTKADLTTTLEETQAAKDPQKALTLLFKNLKAQQVDYYKSFTATWTNMQTTVTDTFTNILTGGTKLRAGLKSIFASIANDLAKMFVSNYITSAFSKLLSSLSSSASSSTSTSSLLTTSVTTISSLFKAEGGSAYSSNSYVVGEHGPEVFTPSSNGVISSSSTINSSRPTVINMNISTPNAESFRRSQRQIYADANRAVSKGGKFN